MPFYQNYPQNTVFKALEWLKQQPGGWSQHIKDSNIAVKMYLKSKKHTLATESDFKKELKELEQGSTQKTKEAFKTKEFTEAGAVLINQQPAKQKLELKKELAHNPHKKPCPVGGISEKSSKLALLKQSLCEKQAFYLDQKSLKSLKQVKDILNIQQDEEALRLLIQLGQKS